MGNPLLLHNLLVAIGYRSCPARHQVHRPRIDRLRKCQNLISLWFGLLSDTTSRYRFRENMFSVSINENLLGVIFRIISGSEDTLTHLIEA